ncbi:MAG: M48 family metalloprotease, partial [Leptospiraceae bacterium]|nr:M48 family metalloprotease [Leptospiraceae bacterium]
TAVDGMYSQFFEKGRKQEEEMDSDKAGIIYMVQAGYNPEAALTYLNKLNSSPENETLVKTHPPVKERISALSSFIKEQKFSLNGKTNKERYQNEYKSFLTRNP